MPDYRNKVTGARLREDAYLRRANEHDLDPSEWEPIFEPPAVSSEDIDQARREMWGKFPRDFPRDDVVQSPTEQPRATKKTKKSRRKKR